MRWPSAILESRSVVSGGCDLEEMCRRFRITPEMIWVSVLEEERTIIRLAFNPRLKDEGVRLLLRMVSMYFRAEGGSPAAVDMVYQKVEQALRLLDSAGYGEPELLKGQQIEGDEVPEGLQFQEPTGDSDRISEQDEDIEESTNIVQSSQRAGEAKREETVTVNMEPRRQKYSDAVARILEYPHSETETSGAFTTGQTLERWRWGTVKVWKTNRASVDQRLLWKDNRYYKFVMVGGRKLDEEEVRAVGGLGYPRAELLEVTYRNPRVRPVLICWFGPSGRIEDITDFCDELINGARPEWNELKDPGKYSIDGRGIQAPSRTRGTGDVLEQLVEEEYRKVTVMEEEKKNHASVDKDEERWRKERELRAARLGNEAGCDVGILNRTMATSAQPCSETEVEKEGTADVGEMEEVHSAGDADAKAGSQGGEVPYIVQKLIQEAEAATMEQKGPGKGKTKVRGRQGKETTGGHKKPGGKTVGTSVGVQGPMDQFVSKSSTAKVRHEDSDVQLRSGDKEGSS